MYAFRKPFTVATYSGYSFLGMDYKVMLVIAQVIGYALSKFVGIRHISEMLPQRRIISLITLIAFAELSLIGFALVDPPYNIILMFLNGIPLGLVWGIVFSYLEGRRISDILSVILCSSFIMSSGIVKSIGLFVIQVLGFSEWSMPAITGAFFILPLFFFAVLLERIPPPSFEDQRLQTPRIPMTKQDRMDALKKFAAPITASIFFYVFLTAFRDFRDNFARELWEGMHVGGEISVYSKSEVFVAFLVLALLGLAVLIRNSFRALLAYHFLMLLGLVLLGFSTLSYQQELISPFAWMVSTGFGLYICYVPFNSLFFDRFIGAFKIKGNAGFLIYMADAFGYAGSVCVLLYKSFGNHTISWLDFFINGTYVIVIIGLISLLISFFGLNQFHHKLNHQKASSYEQGL